MKRKIFSVLLALALVCSFSLVTAVPVSAQISSITVTAPNGGELWSGSQDITWTSVGNADTVNIYYTTDNFADSHLVVSATTNTGTYSWDTASVLDGTNYQIKVRATSDVDVFDTSDAVFTIDNTKPVVTIDIPEYINVANELTVPVTITSDEDGAYGYNISGVTDTGGITAGAPVVLSLNLSALPDGLVTADADVTDAAGNVGDAIQDTATKDTEVLAPSNLAAPDYINDANQLTYTVPGNAEADSTVEVRITDGTTELTGTAIAVGGAFSIAVDCSTLEDGTGNIIIDAKATDAAGNESPYSTAILRDKDTLLPAVTIDIPEYINDANKLAVPVTITSDEDGDYSYNISGVSDTGGITAGAPVVLSLNLNALPDGLVTADADVTDAAGNVGDAIQDTATKDTGVPAEPSALAAPDYINDANQATYTVMGSAEADSTVEVRITDGTTELTGTGASDGTFSIAVDCSTLEDGAGNIIIDAKATDAAGNESPYSAAITKSKDTLLPAAPAIALTDPINAANADSVSITGTGEADATLDYSIIDEGIGEVTGTGTVDGGGVIDITGINVSALDDGTLTASVTQTDAALNTSAAGTDTATKDIVAPSVTVTSPDGGESWLAGATHDITWTATDDNFGDTPITIKYSINGGADWNVIVAGVANTGTYSWTVPNLNSTAVLVKVIASDLPGNSAADSSNSVFTITADIQAPSVTVNSPNGGESWQGGSTQTISWTADDNLTPSPDLTIDLYYSTDGGTTWEVIATSEANDGAYAWMVVEADNSQCLVKVEATDSIGNVGSDTSNNVFTISPVPTPVTSIYLKTGWNLISLMLMPDDAAILEVLNGVDVDGVYAYDASIADPNERWSSYVPGIPSDLETMVDGKGYWVEMSADATLVVLGDELPVPPDAPPTYDVVVGWNLIGFKSTTPMKASSYLEAINGKYAMTYGFADGDYFVVQTTTANLDPGYGYWIAVTEAGTIYP